MNHDTTTLDLSPSPVTEELAPLRILLAEDNARLRSLLACVLRSDGHEVVEVSDGSELLEEIASVILDPHGEPYDLIVAKQRLPGIPGLSVLAGLRARSLTTAFILMTSDPSVQAGVRRLRGVILDRPANVRDVRAAVRAAAAVV